MKSVQFFEPQCICMLKPVAQMACHLNVLPMSPKCHRSGLSANACH